MIRQNNFAVVLCCLQTEHEIMKQSKITSYLPWESKHGVPSSVFRAIFMRVACPNELQYLVSKQNHRYARARTGHECVDERRVPLYFKRDRTK